MTNHHVRRGVRIIWGEKQIEIAANIYARLIGHYGNKRGVLTAIDKEVSATLGVGQDVARARRQTYGAPYRSARTKPLIFDRKYAVPAEVQRERESRLEGYDARDLTGLLMGDPPKGFSQLERR